jgi:hypothetical protein
VERQNRRDADKILRDTVARRFEEHWKRASELQVEMVNQGMIRYVDDMEKAAIALRTFIDKISTAARGYSVCSMRSRSTRRNSRRSTSSTLAFFDLAEQVKARLTTWKPASATKKPCPPPSATSPPWSPRRRNLRAPLRSGHGKPIIFVGAQRVSTKQSHSWDCFPLRPSQ